MRNGQAVLSPRRPCQASAPGTPAIVCTQAGNVNTGACDDLRTACDLTHVHGGWVHVDGAFGLWAAASPATRHLVDGVELADSWACDGHKWLNVPYDCGYAFCSRPAVHADALHLARPAPAHALSLPMRPRRGPRAGPRSRR
ncbi:pyridoxal-dependent decarboxylase [Streptomyces sp. NPDC048384]|uniref:pyridoxal-dependent decarboxylase n=1 Tax=Streptomyces sp. NPDC048384 TaxID=3155487 RepID=UPI003424B676